MVLVDGSKYACEACIKGHRSSNCRHTDRALFEVKRKGRPVTQCDNCRKARKTKQLHVKCICESKDGSVHSLLQSPLKKGHTNVPESATFPNGLPEAQASPEAPLSEPDRGGCMCKLRGSCKCCSPRKSAQRIRRRNSASGTHPIHADSSIDGLMSLDTHSSRTPLRLAEFRRLLPRPSMHTSSSDIVHGYHARHHSQKQNYLGQTSNIAHPNSYTIFRNRSVPNIITQDDISSEPPAMSSFSTCANRNVHTLPEPFNACAGESIDEWLGQVPSVPRDSSGSVSALHQPQDAWDNYLAPISEPPSNNEGKYRIQPCCGVFCKCSPETCECDIDREDGYDCRRESLTPDSLSMLSASDDPPFATGTFDNVHAVLPIGGNDGRGTHGEGLMRSQSVGAIYPGPSSWDVRHFPSLPPIPPRNRSISLSSSASSPRSNHHFSSNLDGFSPAVGLGSQSFTSFSLSDLGDSLRPRFFSEVRNITMASVSPSFDGSGNESGVHPIDPHGGHAEEESASIWSPQTSSQLHETWSRTS